MNNSTQHNYEKFDRFVSGNMDAAEEKVFLEDLKDPVIKDEFNKYKMSVDAIRLSRIKTEVIAASERHFNSAQGRNLFLRKTLKFAAGISILLLSGLYFYSLSINQEQVFNSLYVSYKLPITRSAEVSDIHLDSLYSGKDFKGLVTSFKQIESPVSSDYFLAAMSYLEEKDVEKAILMFQKVSEYNLQKGTNSFSQETDFYLALSYLQDGQYQNSASLLEKIENNSSHLFNQNVTAITLYKLKYLTWLD